MGDDRSSLSKCKLVNNPFCCKYRTVMKAKVFGPILLCNSRQTQLCQTPSVSQYFILSLIMSSLTISMFFYGCLCWLPYIVHFASTAEVIQKREASITCQLYGYYCTSYTFSGHLSSSIYEPGEQYFYVNKLDQIAN